MVLLYTLFLYFLYIKSNNIYIRITTTTQTTKQHIQQNNYFTHISKYLKYQKKATGKKLENTAKIVISLFLLFC